MKIVVFGLTISSSWGNGHATLWRGLCRALAARGHEVIFFERDVPYYAAHRDLYNPDYAKLILYNSWSDIFLLAKRAADSADVAMVTSFCPDGISASDLILNSDAQLKVFYDLDTPVTLQRWSRGENIDYIGSRGFAGFDLVLSYTGGKALDALKACLSAKRTAPLYGSVDPENHFPRLPTPSYQSHFSYLGTYAADRQSSLNELFIQPAKRFSEKKFVIGGAQYPEDFPWTKNIFFLRHLPPSEHPAFYCSSNLTLNITREAMANMGYCPSGRLFEAAACGTPIISDYWEGLESFLSPGREILIARSAADVMHAFDLSEFELKAISKAARERALEEHSAAVRARELEQILENTFHQPEETIA